MIWDTNLETADNQHTVVFWLMIVVASLYCKINHTHNFPLALHSQLVLINNNTEL